ncbi:hypothetical protein ElyMa_002290400 [Elysia marginata]|uniref:Uncharacterized protein n=1 Tax=Elysia marginata TaxID=1093978 RepID=A0AAV4G3C4_9GAST|nr:hypothetical protein ElyMa_002290400 [Elysia marginata]
MKLTLVKKSYWLCGLAVRHSLRDQEVLQRAARVDRYAAHVSSEGNAKTPGRFRHLAVRYRQEDVRCQGEGYLARTAKVDWSGLTVEHQNGSVMGRTKKLRICWLFYSTQADDDDDDDDDDYDVDYYDDDYEDNDDAAAAADDDADDNDDGYYDYNDHDDDEDDDDDGHYDNDDDDGDNDDDDDDDDDDDNYDDYDVLFRTSAGKKVLAVKEIGQEQGQ